MLQHTFIHLPGIGPEKEKRLWESGLHTWKDVLTEKSQGNLSESASRKLKPVLIESLEQFDQGNLAFFANRLPASEQWRLFAHAPQKAAYIDIETTGMVGGMDQITVMSLYAEGKVRYYVQGKNLEQFLDDVLAYPFLVSYNGKCFDVPFIEKQFHTKLSHPHIDLRFVLRSLGYRGGLKGCETQLGIHRNELEGVDGYFAVLLWNEYENFHDQKALETLLAYNIEDTVNLERLMRIAYNKKLALTPFADQALDEFVPPVDRIFCPHQEVIDRVRQRYFH